MDDIKYSIIIPCYNSSDTIKRALDSVTQQTYKGRFEVLVVDDCSKDNSQDVIKDYISKTKVCPPLTSRTPSGKISFLSKKTEKICPTRYVMR